MVATSGVDGALFGWSRGILVHTERRLRFPVGIKC